MFNQGNRSQSTSLQLPQRRRGSNPSSGLIINNSNNKDGNSNRNFYHEGLLSRSLGGSLSDMAADLRRSNDMCSIKYSGYLLKRSNQPLRSITLSLSSGSAFGSSTAPIKIGNNRSLKSTAPIVDLSTPKKLLSPPSPIGAEHTVNNDITPSTKPQHQYLNDASSFLLPVKALDVSNSIKIDPAVSCRAGEQWIALAFRSELLAIKSSTEAQWQEELSPSSTLNIVPDQQNIYQTNRPNLDSASSCTELSTQPDHEVVDSAPPADFVDEKDGHIWRAKYCVLEDGVLYFYRNAKDGNSLEAQNERERGTNIYNAVNSSSSDAKLFDGDHLGKSPMPRFPYSFSSGKIKTGASFCTDANVIWEKRVALDKVGAVRSAELEYGEKSLELLAIDYDENPNNILDDEEEEKPSYGDRLILRARSTDEMNEWLFQFHRSLASLMKQMVDLVGSNVIENDGNVLYSSQYAPEGYSFFPFAGGSVLLPVGIDVDHYNALDKSNVSSVLASSLSHGHGRAGLIRGRLRTSIKRTGSRYSPEWEPQYTKLKTRSFSDDLDQAYEALAGDFGHAYLTNADKLANQPLSPSVPAQVGIELSIQDRGKLKRDSLRAAMSAFDVDEHVDVVKRTYSCLDATPVDTVDVFDTVSASKTSEDLLAAPKTRLYVPPFRRNDFAPKHALPTIFNDKNDGGLLSRKFLSATKISNGQFTPFNEADSALFMLDVDSDKTKNLGDKKNFVCSSDFDVVERQVSEVYNDAAGQSNGENARKMSRTSSKVKLGGCADPVVAVGSILDPTYIPLKASKVGKVRTDAYGAFGGGTKIEPFSVGKDLIDSRVRENGALNSNRGRRLRWEVGASSECGVRDSNEDSYIVANDLGIVFAEMANFTDRNDADPLWSNNLSSMSRHHGLFAIFDGHLGNQAARFAVEKLPMFLLDVYRELDKEDVVSKSDMSELILKKAMARLDEEFCNLCVSDGREWECGATALVALVTGDNLTVANLGDSRGVLCAAASTCHLQVNTINNKKAHQWFSEENGWSVLEPNEHSSPDQHFTDVFGVSNKSNMIRDQHRSSNCNVYWKEVADPHSPSREDERERIQAAKGWITTETEIPIAQLHRIDTSDKDVMEILRRCFSDRLTNAAHSSPKKCRAEPVRLLHISRVCGELSVSRALGDRDFKAQFNAKDRTLSEDEFNEVIPANTFLPNSWECPAWLPPPIGHDGRFLGDLISGTPEVQDFRLGEEGSTDEFLLLACDGLWDVMDADDVVRVTRSLLFDKGWSADKAAARLAELATHLGSSDNITVIVVRFFVD